MQDMNLFAAYKSVPRTVVSGILSAVRNRLLELALDLKANDPAAGETDGPTIAEPRVSEPVTQFITNIYGTSPVAVGPGVIQNTTINVEDLGALLNAAQSSGVTDPDALAELATAATSDDKQKKLHSFLRKIGDGTFKLAGNVTSAVAVAGLTPLIQQFLGVK